MTTPTTTTTTTPTTTPTTTTDRRLARTVTESPIGELTILATDEAIVAIHFGNETIGSRPSSRLISLICPRRV